MQWERGMVWPYFNNDSKKTPHETLEVLNNSLEEVCAEVPLNYKLLQIIHYFLRYNVVGNSLLTPSPPLITFILSLYQMIYDVHPCTHNKCWVASNVKLLEQLPLQLSIHFAQCDAFIFQFSCRSLEVWHKLQKRQN